uniref:Uncharacterized protein n=1 Tax=Corvus moneduloides TaxID=1196302 RepID=A0A8U7P058_CORMO
FVKKLIYIGIRLLTLVIGAGAWDQNIYLRLLKGVVENLNQTDCWICSQMPENSARGFPLVGATFPNTTTIYAALSTNRLSHYVNISPDQFQQKLEFEEPIIGSSPVSCVQRCREDPVPKNSGGNKTDSKCGNLTFIGSYANCSEFWTYGGPKGWPVPTGRGWYWICGHNAYKVLPLGWQGCCAIGPVFPHITVFSQLQGLLRTFIRRTKRTSNPLIDRPTRFHSFARWFIPGLGVSELEKAIVNLSAIIETIMNASADAIRAQQIEIKSISQLAIQNKLALDFLYAKEGGVCTVINTSCCSYVDLDKQIETDLHTILEKTQTLHQITLDDTSWGFKEVWDKLTSWLPNLSWLNFGFSIIAGCMNRCCDQREDSNTFPGFSSTAKDFTI